MWTARSTGRRTSCRPTSSAPSPCWRRRARTGRPLPPARRAAFRFHHISTDEVFGALGHDDRAVHREHRLRSAQPLCRQQGGVGPPGARLVPHLRAAGRSSATPATITAPGSFPEKLIPLVTLNALEGKKLPVYGDGSNRRDWLFVEDHAEALVRVIERGAARRHLRDRRPPAAQQPGRGARHLRRARRRRFPTRPARASG